MDKYDVKMFSAFQEVFNWLPLAHLVNESVLIMHGGLSTQDDVTLEDIRSIPRGVQPPKEGLMCDLLWSDPQVVFLDSYQIFCIQINECLKLGRGRTLSEFSWL